MEIIAYHGTDFEIAEQIKKNGFIAKESPEHWLGNGIYFFLDESLAKWWTKIDKPFGSKIIKPAIIKCKLTFEDNKLFNLLQLNTYNEFIDMFSDFYKMYCKNKPTILPNWKKLRCTFCDYVHIIKNLDGILGNFIKKEASYKNSSNQNFKKLLLEYTEIQICVFNEKCISDIEIMKG